MTLYENTAGVLVHNMKALSKILAKAEKHCEDRKIDKAVMLGMRLAPDMFSLTRQVQLVTDFAKGCGARLAGVANPAFTDEETTFEGLQARLAKCVAFLDGLDSSAFNGAESREVTVKIAGKETPMSGQQFINSYAMPHFYFHMTTAYNVLRHNGVDLGKGDFLGRA
jgi:uncharacterized protein